MTVRNGFGVLVERVQALKLFQRNRKPVRLKVLSTLLYYAGLSYRIAAGFASVETAVSYEAVRQWRKRLREAVPKPELKWRRMVAVDETS
jgi:transposase-like protein